MKALLAAWEQVYGLLVEDGQIAIGTLVEGLERRGVLDDTLILVLSDNGGNAEGGPPGVTRGDGPIGFYAALLPLARVRGDSAAAAAIERRISSAGRDGLYGDPPAYYDQNLVLWDWNAQPPHQVKVFDPSARLPRNQLSWGEC